MHGRFDLLIDLLATIRKDNERRPNAVVRIVLIGDLVDRGPSSAQVVETCWALARRFTNFIVLKGNHEAVMVDALTGSFPALGFWLRFGGSATLASWKIPANLLMEEASLDLMIAAKERIPSGIVDWLSDLPMYHQLGNCLFVHAGIRPGVPLLKQTSTDMLWIRDEFVNSEIEHPYIIVHGHTINETGPTLRCGRLGIDTGAYKTGRLTAVGIEGEEHWSISTNALSDEAGNGNGSVNVEESVAAILHTHNAVAAPLPRSRPASYKTAQAAMVIIGVVGAACALGVWTRFPGAPTPSDPKIAEREPPLSRSQEARRAASLSSAARPAAHSADTVRSGPMPRSSVGTHLPDAVHVVTVPRGSDNNGAGVMELRARAIIPSPNQPAFVGSDPSTQSSPATPPRAPAAANSNATGLPMITAQRTAPAARESELSPSAAASTGARSGPPIEADGPVVVARSGPPIEADGPVVVARPVAGRTPTPEDSRERVKALEAIRALRRQ